MERSQYERAVRKTSEVIPPETKAKRMDPSKMSYCFSQQEKLAHCKYLLNNVLGYYDEGKKEKASRHLAAAQMILWSLGLFCVNDLREINRKGD